MLPAVLGVAADQRLRGRRQRVALRPGRLVLAPAVLDRPASDACAAASSRSSVDFRRQLACQELVQLLRQQLVRARRLHVAEHGVGPLLLDDFAGSTAFASSGSASAGSRCGQQPPALGAHQRRRRRPGPPSPPASRRASFSAASARSASTRTCAGRFASATISSSTGPTSLMPSFTAARRPPGAPCRGR